MLMQIAERRLPGHGKAPSKSLYTCCQEWDFVLAHIYCFLLSAAKIQINLIPYKFFKEFHCYPFAKSNFSRGNSLLFEGRLVTFRQRDFITMLTLYTYCHRDSCCQPIGKPIADGLTEG